MEIWKETVIVNKKKMETDIKGKKILSRIAMKRKRKKKHKRDQTQNEKLLKLEPPRKKNIRLGGNANNQVQEKKKTK